MLRQLSSTHWVISLLVCLHLCVTLSLAAKLNLWGDEISALNTTGRDLYYAINHSISYQIQPPTYFVLLHLWRNLNDSIFFARLFSVICAALTIYVIAELSKRFVRGIHPGWVTACICLNPFLIWAAIELKVPALFMLLSALLFLLFHDGYLTEDPQSWIRWLYTLVAIIGLYTQYFIGFILVANAVVLLCLKRWKQLRDYLISMVIVSISFAPVLLFVFPAKLAALQSFRAEGAVLEKSLSHTLKTVYAGTLRYVLPAQGPSEGLFDVWRRIRYLAVAFLAFIIIRYHRLITKQQIVIWLTVLVLTCIFITVGLRTGLIFEHYLSPLFPIATVAVFSALALIRGSLGRKVIVGWTVITVLASFISLVNQYTPMAKQGDWIRVSSYIAAAERLGQPIVLYTPEVEDIMKYYYRGSNRFIPLPQKENYEVYDWDKLVLDDEQEIADAIARQNGNSQQLWLVVDRVLCTVPFYQKSCQTLDGFANKYYTIEQAQTFYGSSVQLLRPKSDFQQR
ncbi:MAG: glycosyltransferase family 39 protein [Leptolyngbyaceae cyanobacterium bins.302]|nr:glycosyltransferase family 39 protein [Leptolyngbyaceae cyanobacterium bins.302]